MARPSKWKDKLTDEILFEAISLLSHGIRPEEVAKQLREKLGESFNRGHVVPLIKTANDRGFLLLIPPHAAEIARTIEKRFGLEAESVHVVEVRGGAAVEHLAAATANLVMRFIDPKPPLPRKARVHLGLGSGRTTHLVCSRLGAVLRDNPTRPELTIHGLTSGWDPGTSIESPVSHFSHFFFDQPKPAVTFMGLSVPPLIPSDSFDEIVRLPLVQEAFTERHKLDIIITSIGSEKDRHCTFKKAIDSHRIANDYGNVKKQLELEGWVGDVQFLPYSDTQALQMKHLRSGVLVGFHELADMARTKGKEVILVAGPCGLCGELKTDALLPLLKHEHMRVFSRLVVDVGTAEALLTESGGGAPVAAPTIPPR